MAFPGSTRGRLLLLGGLYFAQGVPWGFFTVALMLRLTSLGMGPAAIGELTAVAWLPWTLKPLLGPLVDRMAAGRFGRRRPLILAAEIGMAASLLAVVAIDPLTARGLFAALLFAHNLLAAGQDVAVDALAIEILPDAERGRASGAMSAGKYLGTLVGGPALSLLAGMLGWAAASAAAVALLLVPATLVVILREPPARPGRPAVLREALRSFALRATALAGLFVLVSGASTSLLYPLTYPLYRQRLGFSESEVNGFVTLAGAAGLLGMLLGGLAADRLGRRRTIALAAAALAAVYLAFAAAEPLWPRLAVLIAYNAAGPIAGGMLYSASIALCMDVTNPRVAATQFQVYMALYNVHGSWSSWAGGRLAEAVPVPAMFGLAAAVELLPLALLPALDPRRAAERFRQPPPEPDATTASPPA